MTIKRSKTLTDYVILLFLLLAMAMCLVPLLNTVAISFSDKVSAQGGRVFVWPVNFNLLAYGELLKDAQFFRSFMISVYRVALGGAINLVLTILTAYPLSKSPAQFPAKNKYMWFMVFLMLFNGGLVPTYVLISQLRLINSIWALVLPGALPIFSCIILMNYYKTIPASLEEAALIDGGGPWYILLRIYVPLSKPSIAVMALWAIVGHWNDFFSGLIYITSRENYPLQTYIHSLSVSVDWQNVSNMKGEDIARMLSVSNLTFSSAKVVISMIPILCVYPLLQRYFVTGIVMGAVKE
ncbi:MAG: carbohydrate ABC transporter permease [Clostridiales bacterium]|jgi:ABC-type glycerol-3-phosphate transport system permease component|nr:carbohydrate ABC transporter permease [Clostridiales bacterium]